MGSRCRDLAWSRISLEMYEYLALSILIISEGVVSQSQDDVFCTIGTGNGVNGVMYEGECRDLYEDGICALGERLFLSDGNVDCDCDEGWLSYEGRCYQEFTPAFCGENEVLNLGTRKRLKNGETYTCVPNPCSANQLGHRQTWGNRFCHDVSDIQDFEECELYPANPDVNGSPMKCCSSNNRSSCEPNFIQPVFSSGPPTCGRERIWSRRKKMCVYLYVSS